MRLRTMRIDGDAAGSWKRVLEIPENVDEILKVVRDFRRSEKSAKPAKGTKIRWSYEVWRHPSGWHWVAVHEDIGVRTLSQWYQVTPQKSVKAVIGTGMGTGMKPDWKEPPAGAPGNAAKPRR